MGIQHQQPHKSAPAGTARGSFGVYKVAVMQKCQFPELVLLSVPNDRFKRQFRLAIEVKMQEHHAGAVVKLYSY